MTQVSPIGKESTGPIALREGSRKKITGGAIGDCVHGTGVYEFLRTADRFGYQTFFLGAAIETPAFVRAIEENKAEIICVSYRNNSDSLAGILEKFFQELSEKNLIRGKVFYFGGTPSCIAVAKKFGRFGHFFQGRENSSVIRETLFVRDPAISPVRREYERLPLHAEALTPTDMKWIMSVDWYVPMIRSHFGLPSLDDTIDGVKKIAESGTVDLISITPDQNAQENFFEPEKMDSVRDGFGGVPVRTEEDLRRIGTAAQCGNFPLLKMSAVTEDLMKWASMGISTVNNAWGAVPLFWQSELDGRSTRPLAAAIRENREVVRWYAKQGIPVSVNDSYQWSLWDSSDVISVAASYLAAYNAKKLGVKTYIAPFVFHTPRQLSAKMDLAKMLANLEMITRLEDNSFVCLREVGVTHSSPDQDIAKGELAASVLLALALKPQIITVVGSSVTDHAATAEEVIASCKIVRSVVQNTGRDFPALVPDKDVIARKNHLVKEAAYLLDKIAGAFQAESADPLSDPRILAKIVTCGYFDAPQLKNSPVARGVLRTMPVNGGIDAVDARGKPLLEQERIADLLTSS